MGCADGLPFLDGLAIDAAGRLSVAANGAGHVWRVDQDGAICAIARGLVSPSAVAVGQGDSPFPDAGAHRVRGSSRVGGLLSSILERQRHRQPA